MENSSATLLSYTHSLFKFSIHPPFWKISPVFSYSSSMRFFVGSLQFRNPPILLAQSSRKLWVKQKMNGSKRGDFKLWMGMTLGWGNYVIVWEIMSA
jgi:hypothetical protein